MPFPAEALGLELIPSEKLLTARDILAYAAGIGAAEAPFLDDTQAGGLRALPFQCVSFEWPVVLSMRDLLSDTLSSAEARQNVHAAQDSVFHRPMIPGQRLVTRGRLVGLRRGRSGVAALCRLETHDAATGEAVTTTWTSAVYRDVELAGAPGQLAEPPAIPELAASIPETAHVVVVPIAREAPHVYTECADIWNPIHTERAVALAAGLPDIVLHGTATWALAGLEILRTHAANDGRRLKRFSGRFTSMVLPGEPITIRHAASGRGVVRFEVATASGSPAISQGIAFLGGEV